MGNFSRDTFEKIKHYVGVRLQQGVPIVDADWNELEDIRKYELQAFLKWYVGNGVPKGNDGFRILPVVGSDNDFWIKGGDGTPEGAGRCLVEGWDVINESDIKYTEQRLFKEPGLHEVWDIAPLPEFTPPTSGNRTDTVYLDVWEREVNSTESEEAFKHLVNQDIGIETCVRLKREWVVRVEVGTNAPPQNVPEGHVFYVLALLNRPARAARITAEHIVDRRLAGLTIVSEHDIDQIVKDAYGTSYTLDHDGQPNLKVSLREAINALLQGTLPSTLEDPVTQDTTYKGNPQTIKDNQGTIWVFWEQENDIYCKRKYYPYTNPWVEQQLTTDPDNDNESFVFRSTQDAIWLFWRSDRAGSKGHHSIWYKYYNPIIGKWEEQDEQLTTTQNQDNDHNPYALEDSQGNIWVFWVRSEFYSSQPAYNIWYKKYDRVTNAWGSDQRMTTGLYNYSPVAAEDRQGNIWLFWWSSRPSPSGDSFYVNNVYYRRYTDQQWDTWDSQLTYEHSEYSGSFFPFVLRDKDGNLWVFWMSHRDQNFSILYKKISSMVSGEIELTSDHYGNKNQFAFQDRSGDIWVFWESYRSGNLDIWYKRYSEGGGWSRDLALTTDSSSHYEVSALQDGSGDILAFWLNISPYGERTLINIWYKRLIPAI